MYDITPPVPRGQKQLTQQEKDILAKRTQRKEDQRQVAEDTASRRFQRDRDLKRGGQFYADEFGFNTKRPIGVSDIQNNQFYKAGAVDASMTPEMIDILKRRQDSLGGLSAVENQAAREEAFQGQNRSSQLASRALRAQLGASGLRGGAALAAQTELAKNQAAQGIDLERRLLLDNVNLKNQALGKYEETLGSQRQDLLNRQQLNTGRLDLMKQGQIGSKLGFAGLGSADRTAAENRILAEKGLDAIQKSGGGGKKHICGELRRLGLLTDEEYKEFAVMSVWGVFRYGNFSAWYFKYAPTIIANLHSGHVEGITWPSIRKEMFEPAMALLKKGKTDAAAQHYGAVLKRISEKAQLRPFGFPPYDQGKFIKPGLFTNWRGCLQVLCMKEFWKTVFKMSKVFFKVKILRRVYGFS